MVDLSATTVNTTPRSIYYVVMGPTRTCDEFPSLIVYKWPRHVYYIEGPTPEEKQVADLRHKLAIENTRRSWIENYPVPPRPAVVPKQTPRKLMCSMSGWLASNGKKMRRGH